VNRNRIDRLRRATFAVAMFALSGVLLLVLLGGSAPALVPPRIGSSVTVSPGAREGGWSTASSRGSAELAFPPMPPWWPTRLTLLTDSVGLGAVSTLREVMPSWRIQVRGRPALMIDDAARELRRSHDRVQKVVVVALGYNSVWERHREDFDFWSARFDGDANALLRRLRRAGARKIVWVLLRDAPRSAVPRDDWDQHARVAWYFPYVNERLRRLDRRNGDVVLADWATIGDRHGITYDAIHLDRDGALLYAKMVRRVVRHEPFIPR
jgi:hypothetical protein